MATRPRCVLEVHFPHGPITNAFACPASFPMAAARHSPQRQPASEQSSALVSLAISATLTGLCRCFLLVYRLISFAGPDPSGSVGPSRLVSAASRPIRRLPDPTALRSYRTAATDLSLYSGWMVNLTTMKITTASAISACGAAFPVLRRWIRLGLTEARFVAEPTNQPWAVVPRLTGPTNRSTVAREIRTAVEP